MSIAEALLPAQRFSIQKQFHFFSIAIGHHWNALTFAALASPVPMGHKVDHGLGGPLALIEVVTIFREPGEIDKAKIRTARRPVILVVAPPIRCGLADVVEAGPHEFSEHVRELVLIGELDIGAIRPERRNRVVAADLV